MKNDWVWIALLIGVALISGGVAVSGFASNIKRFASAIAHAEGFNVPGSLPNLYNNPGDLTRSILGTGIGVGSQGLIRYATAEDGWNDLYAQVQEMFDGTSAYYNPSMTITEIAQKYAGNWQNWANNVSGYLGVSADTPLSQI